MPLPEGTYPVGGPIIQTAERLAASEALYSAGVVWISGGGIEAIQRTGAGTAGDPYAYAWHNIGGAPNIPDNSIGFIKILAATAEQQAQWRDKIGSAHIGAGNDLPALAEHNIGDVWIIAGNPTPGALSFVDIHDPGTPLDTANPFDVMMVFPGGRIPKVWTRVGTIGGINPAVQTALDLKITAADFPPFLQISHIPAGLAGGDNAADYPSTLDLVFSEKLTSRTITGVALTLDGNALELDDGTPVSGIDAPSELQGLLRFNIANATKTNLAVAAVRHGRPYASGSLTITFSEGDPHRHDFAWPLKNPAFRVPARFETAVGASPAVLPVGTYDIDILGAEGAGANQDRSSTRIRLAAIPAANRRFHVRLSGGDFVRVTMRYAVNTRTLTYSLTDSSDELALTAIGVA